ncbi:DNA polymerase III subunit chi [Shimia thalassica]|uniref:DNA polymerase III subunit chi n=1 Tax=Shimia thalassica TaxID=1715693 RepID=UPI0026E2640A|nr:DNA polymerase III subunit chi [Shimia thalassica]MDO6480698.1 DNA polymerase III subunit chi [Shimia thalassica]
MGAAFFYHLTRHPLDITLPMLIGKARGAGWRVLVRGRSPERMDWLDQKLWLQGDESFLPHGQAGGPHDADQPVLLSHHETENGNQAGCLMTIDGASISSDEVRSSDRVCILFDGHDMDAVAQARVQWKTLTDAGCAAQYWSEEDGGWAKKAEKAEA